MNLRFLGDAYDHWKGSLFNELARAQLLHDFAVDPMAADGFDWSIADFRLYAHLLRISPEQVIRHDSSLMQDRSTYFSEIRHDGDLFFDPDTGIAPVHFRYRWQYLLRPELHELLVPQDRVVAVYQHIGRIKTRQRLQILLLSLGRNGSPFVCCSYETPSVAMLFFSRNRARVLAIRDLFEDLLGRHADQRIELWETPGHS